MKRSAMRRSATMACAIALAYLLAGSAAAHTDHAYQQPGGAADGEHPFIAAGYRALFTCSAHFAMHRPLKDILEIELADTTPLQLPAPEIDAQRRLVRAGDGNGDLRIAAFRDGMGCTLLPPHWGERDLGRLPYLFRQPSKVRDDRDFPAGERTAPDPNAEQQGAVGRAFDGSTYGAGNRTAAVLVVDHDHVVAESYRPGFGPYQGYRTWSTAKSITATLIGIATAEGLLEIRKPAPIPHWQQPADPRRAITLEHLMWMSSGLWSAGSNTNALYFGGQDVISAAAHTPLEAAPGSRWKYANNDTLLLLVALRAVLDDDAAYLRFPYDKLFGPLGMQHTWMETDHLGNFIGSSQVYTTARDLARFGLLYLNDGVWEGRRLLPEGWTTFVATPAPSRPNAPGELGYGGQFWLLDQLPGIPPGTYASMGNKGQYVVIVPARNLVIVRTGVDPAGVRFDLGAFVRDIVAVFSR
jgi:CubicO group peptidase (beta-lactamase class C family)